MNKINKSSIYELFSILNKGEYKKEDILALQQIKLPTLYKNLQKLKSAGFEIEQKEGLYYLKKYRGILDFSKQEKSTIAYILYIAYKNLAEFKFTSLYNIIGKFLILAKRSDYDEVMKKFQLIKKYYTIEENQRKIEELEKYIIKKESIKITLKSNKALNIVPLKFSIGKKGIFLNCKNAIKNTKERININSIIKIEKCIERDYIESENEIIFELYGALAKRYMLKQNERILKKKKDSVIIAVNAKDKDSLHRRLLRYDILCKILFPKTEAEAFNKLIDKAIINIDSIKGEDE